MAIRSDKVNIRPGVSVLSVLRHLNYEPWYAIAEFVDNALQSYQEHKKELREVEGEDFSLRVNIELNQADDGQIVVRDNAAGIYESEYERAFRPAELPPDRSGLAEFGMGMKSAACWFAPRWYVTTTALGEDVERTIRFDINQIVEDRIEELDIESRPVRPEAHYTVVTLEELHRAPHGRTIGKIKDHLASIYRHFIRKGDLELRYNGERLTHETPEILVTQWFKEPDSESVKWKKDIDFDFGEGLSAHGFAAIRATASTSQAGFSLFRRGRVIEGSGDQKYRPREIFGASNSYRYQRVFGELHLEGFDVSHTKDGFVWEENEEVFLELLREELDSPPKPLLKQAEGYRVRPNSASESEELEEATRRTAEDLEERAGPVLDILSGEEVAEDPPEDLTTAEVASRRTFDLELHHVSWRVVLELSSDPSIVNWVEVSDTVLEELDEEVDDRQRTVGVRLSVDHPFTLQFCGPEYQHIEPLVRLAAAIGLAETSARDGGVSGASTIRRNINQLLGNALAQER